MQRLLQDHVKAAKVSSLLALKIREATGLFGCVETFRDLRTCLASSPAGSNDGLASLRPSPSGPPTKKYAAFRIGFGRYCISLVAHHHRSLEL